MFQECTHLVWTTWPHLPLTLGHPKIGLHPPRTGQHHHLQVCFSLFLSHSVCLCHCTRQIWSVLPQSESLQSTPPQKWVLMSHLLLIKITRGKHIPPSSYSSLAPCGIWWKWFHSELGVPVMPVWHVFDFKEELSRMFACVHPQAVPPCFVFLELSVVVLHMINIAFPVFRGWSVCS